LIQVQRLTIFCEKNVEGQDRPDRIFHIEIPAQHTTLQQAPSQDNIIDSTPGATIDIATLDSKS
jgi:hypothetical protein